MKKIPFIDLCLYAFIVVLIIINYERGNYPVMFITILMFISLLVDLKKSG